MSDDKQLTFGGKAAGVTFNPSNNDEVTAIKGAAAQFIDEICGIEGEKVSGAAFAENAEVAAMRKLAQRHAQEAQMWAVKAATWEG